MNAGDSQVLNVTGVGTVLFGLKKIEITIIW